MTSSNYAGSAALSPCVNIIKTPLTKWAVLALLVAMGPTSDAQAAPPSACGRITTFADGKVPTREIHVSVNGNDSTADGSLAKPFATVFRASQQATPGTAIRVHAGTYLGNQYVENISGTATAPIWIGGAPGEAPPLFSGGSLGFLLVKVRYMVFHDMEIQGTTFHGINIHDNSEVANPEAVRFVVFRNLNIHDAISGQCLKMAGVNDFWVLDGQFARCSIVNIDGVGCHNGVVARSTIGPSEHGVQFKGGSSNIDIRWNRIVNISNRALNLGGGTGFSFFRPPLSTTEPNYEAKDIRAIGNIIENSKAPVAFAGCQGCMVANNTIIDPITFIFRILKETGSTATYTFGPTSDGRIFNNLIYFNRSAILEFVNVGPGTAPTTFQIKNNLWYAHDDPAQSQPAPLPVPESNGVYGQDPNFINPGTGSYHILTTSPAAGAGVRLHKIEGPFTGDFDGRCWDKPPSIGAFEATSGSLSGARR